MEVEEAKLAVPEGNMQEKTMNKKAKNNHHRPSIHLAVASSRNI